VRSLPGWAWLVFLAGVALLVGGAFVSDGTYVQSLMGQIGSAALLVIPIVLVERSIISTLRKRLEDAAAVNRTEEMIRFDDVVTHFEQVLTRPKPPPTAPGHLGRMLGAEGWTPRKSRDGYQLWAKDGRLFAVPFNSERLPRGVVLGVSRYVGWTPERFVERWNATRPEGTDFYETPPA